MFRRPFRDLGGRKKHALDERAAALEIEMFLPAIGRIGGKANRQYEIDHFHCSTFAVLGRLPRPDIILDKTPISRISSRCPLGSRNCGRLRARPGAVNKAGWTEVSRPAVAINTVDFLNPPSSFVGAHAGERFRHAFV